VESVVGIVEEKERGIVARQLSGEKRPEGIGGTGDSLGKESTPSPITLACEPYTLLSIIIFIFLRSLGVWEFRFFTLHFSLFTLYRFP
jgi:hypothetical protein